MADPKTSGEPVVFGDGALTLHVTAPDTEPTDATVHRQAVKFNVAPNMVPREVRYKEGHDEVIGLSEVPARVVQDGPNGVRKRPTRRESVVLDCSAKNEAPIRKTVERDDTRSTSDQLAENRCETESQV